MTDHDDDLDELGLLTPELPPCDSCGAHDEPVSPVRRVYVTLGSDGEPDGHEVLDEVERWCFPCRSSYPHEPVEA